MPRVRKGDVVWVEPRLVVEVEFGEWTHDGHLRHPSYKGLRDDKPAAAGAARAPGRGGGPQGQARAAAVEPRQALLARRGDHEGRPARLLPPVAPVLVPHLRHRPFTMRRYPDGIDGKAFFQKDAPSHMPEWIPTYRALVSTRDGGEKKWVEFPLVNDELALLWMVNMGCIDMNAWYSRVDRPDRPDFVLFDLDPTPEVPWAQTIEVALLLQGLLDGLGLAGFPKTSGGKGFHVLVPLDRRSTYDDSRAFAEHVAAAIARTHPELATTQWSKARRRGVLIDANQNGRGQDDRLAYSVRPRPGAPVSTPLRWDEVTPDLDPASVHDGRRARAGRAARRPRRPLLTTRQSLSKALSRLEGG